MDTHLDPSGFASVCGGGFACSEIQFAGQRRLDQIGASQHDVFARQDYLALSNAGVYVARDGVSWAHTERHPRDYEFSRVLELMHAARDAGVQVIWDLCDFGWPAGLDPFTPEFVDRFARFARAFARVHAGECATPLQCLPIRQIATLSEMGGDLAMIAPFSRGRADELRRQLVRAALAARDAIVATDPRARFYTLESPDDRDHDLEVFDMLCGRECASLGGEPAALEVLGLGHASHAASTKRVEQITKRSLAANLELRYARYGRPALVDAIAGEMSQRAPRYARVCDEVREAMTLGVPVHAVCLTPIIDTASSLAAHDRSPRSIDATVALELRRQQGMFSAFDAFKTAA